jgi:hypothetical protein
VLCCIDRDAEFVCRLPVWPVRKIKGEGGKEGEAKIRDFGGFRISRRWINMNKKTRTTISFPNRASNCSETDLFRQRGGFKKLEKGGQTDH